ncbi:TIGR04255 family protein [Roseomonas sp. F4]
MDLTNPFDGPPPNEVALIHAPLARVIAQVRFPPILALENAAEISGFQKTIREYYPVLRKEEVREVSVSAHGEVKVGTVALWKFSDARDEWWVSVTNNFVALETRAYSSRKNFIDRLDLLFHAANAAFRPQVIERLGLRYVNRLKGPILNRLSSLVRQEMLGISASSLASFTHLSLTETHLALQGVGGEMLLRHGHLPPNMSYDPAIEPVDSPTWVLDIDTFRSQRLAFDPVHLSELSADLAQQSYRLFRWITKDEFLREHGGA